MSVSDGVSVWLMAPGELERISVVRAFLRFFRCLASNPFGGASIRARRQTSAGALQPSVISSGRHAWEDLMPPSGKRSRLTIFRPRSFGILLASFKFPGGAARSGAAHAASRPGEPAHRIVAFLILAACGPA